jgi:hypothetical protein
LRSKNKELFCGYVCLCWKFIIWTREALSIEKIKPPNYIMRFNTDNFKLTLVYMFIIAVFTQHINTSCLICNTLLHVLGWLAHLQVFLVHFSCTITLLNMLGSGFSKLGCNYNVCCFKRNYICLLLVVECWVRTNYSCITDSILIQLKASIWPLPILDLFYPIVQYMIYRMISNWIS